MTQVRRVSNSTHRVTQHQVYDVVNGNQIYDNNGKLFTPSMKPSFWVIVDNNVKTKEDKPMSKVLKIEDVTLVNGERVSDFSEESLIRLIIEEEKKVEYLSKINVNSKAIHSISERHLANVGRLVELLDSKSDE